MRKGIAFKIIYILTAIIILINTVISIKQSLFPDINRLPEGVLADSQTAPGGDKTLNLYVVKNNVGCGVRGEITFEGGKTSNVFWQTGIDAATSGWVDEQRIVINNIVVDIYDVPYDCRNGTSLFAEGVLPVDILDEHE